MLDSENRKVNKYGFYKKKIEMISEIHSLSADCLPSLIKASVCGVSVSQFFGRSVAYFFHPLGLRGKTHEEKTSLKHGSE
ncbi:hypothetical protein [Peribacillus frigoritolerans]|uniref:hypothetical protein n=1 Tax=Peribacillus frigoritolerans TaxID=450367 RepID=UPI000FD96BA4|nr:hypothetical protein [Peribacillus frigoritolerans]AZV60712.1 hypothetical protein DOZ91_08795 [Peribacillus frigoritolerans]